MLKMLTVVITMLFTVPAYAVDGTALLKQVDRNLNPESYESYRKLINIEPDGRKKEYTLFTVKKGVDKVASLFIAPASEKGRSTLRLGDNMWLYIPNVGKPIRITSLQSVVGGVFNNADILQLDYAAEYNCGKGGGAGERIPPLSQGKDKEPWPMTGSRCGRTRSKKLPTKIECLTEADMLIKTLYFKDVKDFGGGIVRPAVIETDSPLYKGYKSIMILAKIKKRNFKDEVFTLTFMPNIESLR